MATGQAETLVAKQAYHLTGRAPLEKGLENQANRMLHGPVGIFDYDAVVVAQQTGREGQGQVAALGLLLHARNETAP
jgi:hypothetical protein